MVRSVRHDGHADLALSGNSALAQQIEPPLILLPGKPQANLMVAQNRSLKVPKTAAFSTRFIAALSYATRLHAKQIRKQTERPYVGHLLGVTSIVIEYGGDEDMAIAALLHDAVEDQGGMPRLREIQRKFGKRVAHIVDGCTDAYTVPKAPWLERKRDYIARVAGESDDVRLVSAADKLSNARETLHEVRTHGEAIYERFAGKKSGTLWYYRELLRVFRAAGSNPLVEELERVVSELERLDGVSPNR
jgi:(p)ppGpp synthase/HD superfamily hydrolase